MHEDRALICAPPSPPLGGPHEEQISKLHDYSKHQPFSCMQMQAFNLDSYTQKILKKEGQSKDILGKQKDEQVCLIQSLINEILIDCTDQQKFL